MPSKNKDIDGANESVKKVNEVEKNKNAKVDEQTSEKIKNLLKFIFIIIDTTLLKKYSKNKWKFIVLYGKKDV